jgi:hypothetical protein
MPLNKAQLKNRVKNAVNQQKNAMRKKPLRKKPNKPNLPGMISKKSVAPSRNKISPVVPRNSKPLYRVQPIFT